jgi:hypothetical protein
MPMGVIFSISIHTMAVLGLQMLGADSASWSRLIICRRTATSIARSEQGPLRHLVLARSPP